MLYKNFWYYLRTGLTLPTILLALVGLTLMLSTSPAFAKKAHFDHDTTGFILSGSHQRVSCDTCHIRGVFKGTPKQCQDCHSRISQMGATKKHANHIQSSDSCDDCHTEISFSNATVDHSNVTGTCVDCHNGITATGKTRNHVKSGDSCDNCHSTRAWTPARFDHSNITAACSTCHNGIAATGKTANHIPSSNACADCHTGFTTFKGANPHKGVTGNCFSCHNGSIPSATSKAQAVPTHIQSSNVCEDCHTGFSTFKGANIHRGITNNCFSCHNGAIAKGKAAAVPVHIPSSNVCEDCHSNTKFDNFSGANPHKGVTGNCFSCHNGSIPSAKSKAQAIPPHIPSSNVCEDCHAGFSTFKGANIHVGITNNCFSCHNGAIAIGKAAAVPVHIPSSNVCEDCHSNTKFDNFSGANPHKGVTGNCFSCHNGSIPSATSKAQAVPTHIQSSNVCEDCHKSFSSFKGANVHAGVTNNCFSCHNGAIAKGKAAAVPVHIPSSNVCEDCHTGFTTFAGANPHKGVTGNCFSCHNGSIPTAKSKAQAVPTHITSSNVCEDCHKSFITFAGANPHTGVTTNCVSCHNSVIAKGKAQAVPPHIPSSDVCEDCHKNFTSFAGVNVHNGVTSGCFSCHNGTSTTAIGKNAAPTLHVPSSNICEDCHKNFTSFAGAKYDHAGVTTCAQCHLTKAPQTNHSTSTQCETCHTYSPKDWKVIIFNHNNVSGGSCLDCHRNDKNPGHFVTSLSCDACHLKTGKWTDKPRYDHSSPNYPGDHGGNVSRCTDCHTSNSQSIPWNNIATYKPDCAGCHASRYTPGPHTKYLNTKYTVSELRNCAGACHEYTNATLTTIKRTRNSEHRPNGSFD